MFEESGKLKGTSTIAAQKGTTVTVENLFNNLPVRRRELERNIKREWGRVTGVLGQYACIQTGIKFSVSQQAAKGKKTTLFATKGNRTTRDNIVNVFGAKTLAALVPLELTLELEPTAGQGRKLASKGDDGKTQIRIVGHISRPLSGEGRQTPDRQMFFVNARPCGLPQVSRAFNEVYKTYNASQSPFIFANIELDTHLYDVNVSPDKRTILLHDQTRMLENLKTNLIALFESQEYTVPISHIPGQKQPSYKQLTINRESAAPAQTPKGGSQANNSHGRDGEHELSSGEEDEPLSGPSNANIEDWTSKNSTTRDREAVNLMSKWMGRKTDHYADAVAEPQDFANEGSREELEGVEELPAEESQLPSLGLNVSEHGGPPAGQESSPPSPGSILEPDQNMLEKGMSGQRSNDNALQGTQEFDEPPIPALQSPPKPSSTLSNIFIASPRRQRPPPEVATITIGDHTMTQSIGTHVPKRQRISNEPTTPGRSKVEGTSLPSFGSRLSQRFAAPGTTDQLQSSKELDEENTQVVPSSPHSVDGSVQHETLAEDQAQRTTLSQKTDEDGEELSPHSDQSENDGDYVDEEEKKAREEATVQEMIQAAEEAAAQPSEENVIRAKALLKGGGKKKDMTLNLVKVLETDFQNIYTQFRVLNEALSIYQQSIDADVEQPTLEAAEAEEKLSLTISKTDFAKMKVIGQFNLGFILATRLSEPGSDSAGDELFIIDQHASDEKYNFERLQATTIVQSQRLVQPKTLDLTALEEEIVIENKSALETNGFIVNVDQSGEAPVGSRCQLVSLPLSRETTFSLTDLDELLALLSEHPTGTVPRPSRVRKMFAMRACRSSIMIGKTLTHQQMGKVVKHLGELDKPWNCPHGRPTMRHLCTLGAWDETCWREGTGVKDKELEDTDWVAYVRKNRR